MEDTSLVETQEAQLEDVKVWNDRFFWNFQVGPNGGKLLVRDVLQTFPQDALDIEQEFAFGFEGSNVQVKDVSLNIPPDALEKEITVTIVISWNKSDLPFLYDGQVLVGPVVHCLPHGLCFKQPAKLSFHSDQEAQVLQVLSSNTDVDQPMQWFMQDSYTSISGTTTECITLTDHMTAATVRGTRTMSWPKSLIPVMLTTHSVRSAAIPLLLSVAVWLVFQYSAASVSKSVYSRPQSVRPVAELVSWKSTLATLWFAVATPAVMWVVGILPYVALITTATNKDPHVLVLHGYMLQGGFDSSTVTTRKIKLVDIIELGFSFSRKLLTVWLVVAANCSYVRILPPITLLISVSVLEIVQEAVQPGERSRFNSVQMYSPNVLVCFTVAYITVIVVALPWLCSVLYCVAVALLTVSGLVVVLLGCALAFVIDKIAPGSLTTLAVVIWDIVKMCTCELAIMLSGLVSRFSEYVWILLIKMSAIVMTAAIMWPAIKRSSATRSASSSGSLQWVKCSVRWRQAYSTLKNTQHNGLVRGLCKINVSTTPCFTIGRGSSSTDVYLGLLDDGREMAVKRVAMSHQAERINEVKILVQLKHKNIVLYWTREDADGHMYTALRLCEFTLDEWLRTVTVQPDWNRKAPEMVKQLLQAMKYLHQNRVIHCDLTPDNILVEDNKKKRLKLGDFGLSCRVQSGGTSCFASPAGTQCWKAREVLQCPHRQQFSYCAYTDIQVAGMVVFYMMSGRIHPYDAALPADVERNIINDNPDLSAVTDCIALDIVEPMLAANPVNRPTAEVLLRHPYVWNDERKYEFLAVVGDEQEVATCDQNNVTSVAIENTSATVLPLLAGRRDWGGLSVLPELSAQFQRQCRRSGYTESVCHLLRTLRNIKSHYNEQPVRAKAILGHTPYPFTYFNTELPALFLEVYSIIKDTQSSLDDWTQRELLRKFF